MASNVVELEILRWAARARLPSAANENVPSATLRDVNWTRLLWLGRQVRALLFLQQALADTNAPCPEEIRAQLDELRAAVQLQGLARAREICALHDLFATERISFVPIDDWAFERTFNAGRSVIELTGEIRALIAPSHLRRARELLAKAGHPESTGRFQVAAQGQTPVALIEDLAPHERAAPLAVGGRMLAAPTAPHWLRLLATEAVARSNLDLVRAWKVVLLREKYVRDLIEAGDSVASGIARCRVALGLPTTEGSVPPPPAPAVKPASAVIPVAPYVPTPEVVADRMLSLAATTPADLVVDLGCGDGRVVIAAAKRFGARGLGIDCDPALIANARDRAEAERVSDRAAFVCGDLFAADLRMATILCLYLLPSFYEPIRERLLRHARPGTRVISHDYTFPDWAPEQTELVRTGPARVSQIYLWRVA